MKFPVILASLCALALGGCLASSEELFSSKSGEQMAFGSGDAHCVNNLMQIVEHTIREEKTSNGYRYTVRTKNGLEQMTYAFHRAAEDAFIGVGTADGKDEKGYAYVIMRPLESGWYGFDEPNPGLLAELAEKSAVSLKNDLFTLKISGAKTAQQMFLKSIAADPELLRTALLCRRV